MFKLEFTLKQHTPLIHFQHEHSGATLRGTELKPKLDKFIIKVLEGKEKIPKSWLIGHGDGLDQEPSLDYKLKIIAEPNDSVEWYVSEERNFNFPPFFANLGTGNIAKYKYGFHLKPLKLQIFAFNEELRKEITKNICSFFLSCAFGTRQSKGFGFFYPQEDSPAFADNSFFSEPKASYSFKIDLSNLNDERQRKKVVFESIDLFYRLLRSGLNRKYSARIVRETVQGSLQPINSRRTVFYCKPVLFSFLHAKGIQWDKKSIKVNFLNKHYYLRKGDKLDSKEEEILNEWGYKPLYLLNMGLPKQITLYKTSEILTFSTPNPVYLWRDLFGLSTEESWKSYGTKLTKNYAVQKNDGWHKLSNKDERNISRYKSPIQFLPFFTKDNTNCTVFFNCSPTPLLYQNSTFLLSMNTGPDLPLKIGNNLNVSEIIDWLLIKGNFNLNNNWIGKKNYEFETLNSVLGSLKKH